MTMQMPGQVFGNVMQAARCRVLGHTRLMVNDFLMGVKKSLKLN